MKNLFVKARNSSGSFLYRYVLKPVLFSIDPEKVHNTFAFTGRVLGSNFVSRGLVRFGFGYKNKILRQRILGIEFSNPVGLAAGYDKDARCIGAMGSVGFGFVEVGSITARPCAGNDGVRLWRLKKSKGLLVNYGLNNEGADVISKRLRGKRFSVPFGVNIAMTNSKNSCSLKGGISDYVYSYKKFAKIGDYFTVNISCPNSFGGENFAKAERLDKLLFELFKVSKVKPVFIKLGADLFLSELDEIIGVCDKYPIDGFVISNLTKNKRSRFILDKDVADLGGVSGVPVRELSTKIIRYVYSKTKGRYVIIGCGGIFSAKDAYEKIRAGASLVQLFTGMIYQGPWTISELNRGLVELLRKDGFSSVSQAVGVDVYNKRRVKFRYRL